MKSTKKEVAKGFVWHSAEKFGNTAFQTLISLFLARILTPSDFGLVAMLVIFSAVAQSISDSGLSQAIIRTKEPSQRDYTSAFYFNIALSLLVYAILLAATPLIADFYHEERLRSIAPIFFAIIPINALGFTQATYLLKTMDFKTSSKIVLLSSLLGGMIAVYMAWQGYGVWSIVGLNVSRDMFRVVLLWSWRSWRPTGGIDTSSLKNLLGFGSNLMVSGIISHISANVSQLLIGRVYNPATLGLYYQSQKQRDTFVTTLIIAFQNVTYPALSQIQDDKAKLCDASRKMVAVISFVLFPVLTGLILTAHEFFLLILTDKWLPAVPYFIVMCAASYFRPVDSVCYNILRVKGHGRLLLRLEVTRQIILFALLFATVYVSVMAVTVAMFVYAIVSMLLFSIYSRRDTGYRLRQQIADSMPYIALCAAMAAGVMAIAYLCSGLPLVWIAVIKVISGAAIYGALAIAFNVEAWRETRNIIRKKSNKTNIQSEQTLNDITEE